MTTLRSILVRLLLFSIGVLGGFYNPVDALLAPKTSLQHYPRATSPSSLFFHLDVDASVESFAQMVPDSDFLAASLFGPDAKLPSETVAVEATASELANGIVLPSSQTTTTMITKATTTAATPELESEILLDASHLFLDFSIFLTESKPFLKMAQVIGRILILAQDYIPDKHISPEELGIQVLMIFVCVSKSEIGTTQNPKAQSTPEKH